MKTRDDLADLAADELLEIVAEGSLSEPDANDIIMAARAHWFADDDVAEAGGETDASEEAGAGDKEPADALADEPHPA